MKGICKKGMNVNSTKKDIVAALVEAKILYDDDPEAYEKVMELQRKQRGGGSKPRFASQEEMLKAFRLFLTSYVGNQEIPHPSRTRDGDTNYLSRIYYEACKTSKDMSPEQLRASPIHRAILDAGKVLPRPEHRTDPMRIEGRITDYILRKQVEDDAFKIFDLGNCDQRFTKDDKYRPDWTIVWTQFEDDLCHVKVNFLECDEHRHDGYWPLSEHRKMTCLGLRTLEHAKKEAKQLGGEVEIHTEWIRFNTAEYTVPHEGQMANLLKIMSDRRSKFTSGDYKKGFDVTLLDYPTDHPIVQEYKERVLDSDADALPNFEEWDWTDEEHCRREMFTSVKEEKATENFDQGK